MQNREVATLALGKMLKMDHLANGTARNVELNGKKEKGYISEDLRSQHKADGATIEFGDRHRGGLFDVSRKDPKMADKAMFDYMIGNTDRRSGNMMIKDHADGKQEMLGFDHGLTFGNDNQSLREHSFYGFNSNGAQGMIKSAGKQKEFTKGFVNALADVVKGANSSDGGSFAELNEFIEDHIGGKEAESFRSRFADVVEGVLGNNEKHIGQVLNSVETRKTNERHEKIRKKIKL